MNTASLEMSSSAQSRTATPRAQLDQDLAILSEKAPAFVKLSAHARAAILRECLPRLQSVARAWVEAACRAKGHDPNSPAASEEWLGGPMVTMRGLRLYIEALQDIHSVGKPSLPPGAFRTGWDGRTEVRIFPYKPMDKAMMGGFGGYLRMQKGLTELTTRERQAEHYSQKDPRPGVSLILGAGNVASIPPTDALHKMITEGKVCIVKLNPVNEYLGPFFEQAFAPLVERGYLRFVYGGSDVGSYLCYHSLVEDVHITGSDRTHDMIVWGPPGADRDRRMKSKDPLLKKNITSELGCVTPVMVVPGTYSPQELRFVAENITSQVVNNASFNCNAAKMLVLSKHWPQREQLLTHLRELLSTMPTRLAYYPGAADRYEKLTQGHTEVSRLGEAGDKKLPWTLIRGLDAGSEDPLFCTEPFCGILSEVALDEKEPAAFVRAAAKFSNDKLWGTLSCSFVIHPSTERDPQVEQALNTSLDELRYGVVGINHWPAVAYGMMTAPWGGHPSATMENIQSGIGYVHNTPMIEGIEKCVIRGPLTVFPKPPWFATNRRAHIIGEKMVDLERAPSFLKLPGIVLDALRG